MFSYPAKEFQVRFRDKAQEQFGQTPKEERIIVVARDLDSAKIVELALLRDAISGFRGTAAAVDLVIPYLPYARADRRFVTGDCEGLAVFGRMLFSMSFSSVITLDVHSEVAFSKVHALVNVSPEPLIDRAITDYAKRHGAHTVNILYPDDGASYRYHLKQYYGYNQYLIEPFCLSCWKTRDSATGSIKGVEVPDSSEFKEAPILIVDDICDGGATFLAIEKALRGKGVTGPIGLYVTHGIFSKGLINLNVFDQIYTSDSLTHQIAIPRMHCLDLLHAVPVKDREAFACR